AVGRAVPDEERWKDDLDVYSHLVHVGQPSWHILQLPPHTRRMVHLISDGSVLQPALHHPAATVHAAQAHPRGLVRSRRYCRRNMSGVWTTLQFLPGGLGLVYMRISVNDRHVRRSVSPLISAVRGDKSGLRFHPAS